MGKKKTRLPDREIASSRDERRIRCNEDDRQQMPVLIGERI
jgi:hypothetical protein